MTSGSAALPPDNRAGIWGSLLPAAPGSGRPDQRVTAVLWDIDGTLISSAGAVARVFLDAVRAICGTRPDPTGLDFGGRLDPDIAALLVQAAGGRPSQVPDVLTRFEGLIADRPGDPGRAHHRAARGARDGVRAG